jgi:hypothetical protein
LTVKIDDVVLDMLRIGDFSPCKDSCLGCSSCCASVHLIDKRLAREQNASLRALGQTPHL